MSTFRYPIKLGDMARSRLETVEAWVDTGASYTLVAGAILERLGHLPTRRRSFRLANGNVVELGLCQVPVRMGEETSIVSCVFGDSASEALLGATALEEFGLGVDPVNHTLMPIVLNLLGFSPEDHGC
jgi:predicted aspartyl protease